MQSRKPHSCGADAPKPAGPCSCGPCSCGVSARGVVDRVSNGNGFRFRMETAPGFEWEGCAVSPPPEPRTCLSHAPLPRGNIKTTEKHRRRAVSARGVVDRVPNGNGFRFRMGTAPGFEWEGCPVSNGPGNAVSNGGMAVSNGGHPVSNDSGKPGFECFGRFLNAAFLGAGGDPPAG